MKKLDNIKVIVKSHAPPNVRGCVGIAYKMDKHKMVHVRLIDDREVIVQANGLLLYDAALKKFGKENLDKYIHSKGIHT